jgi:PAS domain S-box-containing protein
MALLVFSTIVVNYCTSWMVSRASRRSTRTHELIDELKNCASNLKDAETGQRGFLLTGDARYLLPYTHALAEIERNFSALQERVADGRLRPDDLARLRTLTAAKLDELGQTIALKQKNQGEAALSIVRTDVGRSAMEAIAAHVDAMITTLNADLDSERRSALRIDRLRTVGIAVTTAVNLGFLGWSFGRLKREIKAREEASREAHRQKDLLTVTLSSIGDAVIVTDTGGRITFMNKVAEQLTGWTRPEAVGLSLAKVFPIVNEQTGDPVESPVDKVLRLGLIAGLANHTELIRRDGSQLPIDDSGAPIREPDGTLRGVVLVFRDFSGHKETERRLLKAKADVEAASGAKDHFLATLSHELRTPLTPVLATLDAWESGKDFPPALAADVQVVRRNIRLEARLIDDLLDLTRIVRGKLSLELEVVNVHDLVEAVAEMCRGDAQAKGVELTMRLEAERHHARADPARLQQVFWNVLKNAIKFTPAGGHVELSTGADGEHRMSIVCADDGIGMTEQVIARVFRPFEQATEETARQFGGLGLGLAISRGLIEAQGGGISAASAGPGKGSTITVVLPNVDAPQASVTAPASADGAAVPAGRNLSILLVEDHADTARVMSRLLRRLGHTVQTSGTVAEAAELAKKAPYDLLLSDIGLPDGTGIDLIRQVRAHRQVTAIALTGYGMEDDIARCLEAGFTAHLTKPIDFQQLEKLVQKVADGESPR